MSCQDEPHRIRLVRACIECGLVALPSPAQWGMGSTPILQVVLWLLSLLWIAPLGLLALILSVCAPSLRLQVEGQLEKELEMV